MKNKFSYLAFLFCCNIAFAQNEMPKDSFRLINIISGNYTHVEVDATGNIYLINSTNQLKKLNSKGDSMAVFNDVRRYGNVSYVDVSNPLKTLVYYKNYSTIVVLDRLLTLRTTLNLRNRQIFRVNAVTTSYDNNIWIFDEQELKLKKINESGKTLLESNDLRLLTDKIPTAVFITDAENTIYLYDPEQGLFLFDQYAAFKNVLPYQHWSTVTVSKNKLLGISKNQLNIFDMSTRNLKTVLLPEIFTKAIALRIMNDRIFVLNKDNLCIYELL